LTHEIQNHELIDFKFLSCKAILIRSSLEMILRNRGAPR